MNYIANAFRRGQQRAQREGAPSLYHVDELPFNRQPRRIQRRGHVPGLVQCDEFGNPFNSKPPEVFTDVDKFDKRFTVAQAYGQAAMVIRTRRDLPPCTPVFSAGSYDARDERLALTMVEFSELVEQLTWNR